MTNSNGKVHSISSRVEKLENLAYGFVDETGKVHQGFIPRLISLETLGKILVVLALVPAAHYLGVPTEKISELGTFLIQTVIH